MSHTIPFIHNYCDRWCERCAFVQRCSVGISSQGSSDISSDEFWNKLGENMAKAAGMLKEAMEKYGIEMEPVTDDDRMESEIRHLLTESNPLIQQAEAYVKLVDDFFESSISAEALHSVADYVEVVQWYHFFIQVKLSRAVSGLSDDLEDDEAGFQTDYNGSAKIALLSVNRSMEAWTAIYGATSESLILTILALLDKLRKNISEAFPDCEKFKRPGFDD
ncbi:MAG: hypothetical protein K1X81_03075 [Bacteroidia bacterium]|nr:hypothetical protein [Bacteroidia bacterium]